MKRNKLLILIIGLMALGLAFYGLTFGMDNKGFNGPDIVEKPVDGPSIGQEPAEKPGTDQEPVETPGTEQEPIEDPKTWENHTIYVGQKLAIPVFEVLGEKDSVVIDSGVIKSPTKEIALTFDAGWLYDQTINLLDVLDAYGVKSTFFLRGKWVEDNPDLAKEILKRGHSVENHSLTHGHMKEMSEEEIINEMVTSTKIIEKVTGYRPYLFRPPFGEYDSRILKILGQQGYPYTVKWTIDSLDWAEEINGNKITEQYLTDRILSNATDKGIVLMHVGGYQTVNALPKIIQELRDNGYRLVKVNDMLPQPSLTTAGSPTIYTVKKGDTLSSIGRKYGVSVDGILKINQGQ